MNKKTLHLLLAALTALLLTACRTTRTVTVERVTHDTLYQTQHHYDSIYLHDSIRVSEKGDTVRIERWRTKYIERTSHDTIYKARHDTIPVPYEVTKEVEVEKPLTPWQRFRLSLANILLYTLGILAVGWVIRKKIKI